MFAANVFIGAALLFAVSARSMELDAGKYYYSPGLPCLPTDLEEQPHMIVEQDDPFEPELQHPQYLTHRVRRQAQGSVTFNSDGSTRLDAKVPLVGNDRNVLSAVGNMDLNDQMKSSSRGLGLALDNVRGHGLTVMKESVPGFGDRLTGAGKLNVFHNDNHDVSARAFVTRNMPTIPQVPNFNTIGGGLDYTFKNKVGASLGMASTPFLQRRDYSATGNLNLFRSPTSTVDFSGGFKKFDTPFMRSSWEPHFGLTFGRSF